MIQATMEENSDNTPWEAMQFAVAIPSEITRKFDPSYGTNEGSPFCAWSDSHVYFPVCYDGAEWVGSARRNPGGVPLTHQGGG